jgi:hypothetical protein
MITEVGEYSSVKLGGRCSFVAEMSGLKDC